MRLHEVHRIGGEESMAGVSHRGELMNAPRLTEIRGNGAIS
jgi:hypothetical protein